MALSAHGQKAEPCWSEQCGSLGPEVGLKAERTRTAANVLTDTSVAGLEAWGARPAPPPQRHSAVGVGTTVGTELPARPHPTPEGGAHPELGQEEQKAQGAGGKHGAWLACWLRCHSSKKYDEDKAEQVGGRSVQPLACPDSGSVTLPVSARGGGNGH